MALSKEQIKGASVALKQRLQKVREEGARLTLSPVLQGPLSKGEVQVFQEKDSYTSSAISDFSSGSRQERTITWRINILIKNLNAPEPAVPLMEYIKGALEGWQPFGPQPWIVDDGIATVSDSGFRKLDDGAFWWYSIALQATVSELVGKGVTDVLAPISTGKGNTPPVVTPPSSGSANRVIDEGNAGEVLSPLKVATYNATGQLIFADCRTLAHAYTDKVLVISGGASLGAVTSILLYGSHADPSWNWDPTLPIFLGADGTLRQVPHPDAVFDQWVARVSAANAITFDPEETITL